MSIPGFEITISSGGAYYRINRTGDKDLESYWFSLLRDGDRWIWTLSAGPYILDHGNRGTEFFAMREAFGRLYTHLHNLTTEIKWADFKLWEVEKKQQQKEFINGILNNGREDSTTEGEGIRMDNGGTGDLVDIQGEGVHDPDNNTDTDVLPLEDTRRDGVGSDD